jgi:N-acetylneuraminic acid mutarotase
VHTATLLPNEEALVAGGYGTTDDVTNSAEVYNQANGTWTTITSLNTARAFHTATLLASGQVLVAGGWVGGGTLATNSAELYNPASAA